MLFLSYLAVFIAGAFFGMLLIALMANNTEAQSFYKNVENASVHDTGIWINIE